MANFSDEMSRIVRGWSGDALYQFDCVKPDHPWIPTQGFVNPMEHHPDYLWDRDLKSEPAHRLPSLLVLPTKHWHVCNSGHWVRSSYLRPYWTGKMMVMKDGDYCEPDSKLWRRATFEEVLCAIGANRHPGHFSTYRSGDCGMIGAYIEIDPESPAFGQVVSCCQQRRHNMLYVHVLPGQKIPSDDSYRFNYIH